MRDYCRADGTWLYGYAPTCHLKYCPRPPEIFGGSWQRLAISENPNETTDYQVYSRLRVICQPGYSLRSQASNLTIECNTEAKWTGLNNSLLYNQLCEEIHCPELQVSNSLVEVSTTTYQSTARVTCMRGYALSDGNTSLTIECTAMGVWYPPITHCSLVTCDKPEAIENGIVLYNEVHYNSTAEFACREGFNMVGYNTSTCNENGEWINHQPPRCEKVTCRHPGDINHGQIYGRYAEVSHCTEALIGLIPS